MSLSYSPACLVAGVYLLHNSFRVFYIFIERHVRCDFVFFHNLNFYNGNCLSSEIPVGFVVVELDAIDF